MILDVHNHPDWLGYTLPKFLANLDECGIDRSWILPWECPESEYDPYYQRVCAPAPVDGPIPFARALAYRDAAPERFVLGYAPDPRRPEALDLLESAISHHGVRVYGELKLRLMLDDWDAVRMYRLCGEKGLPVLVHIDYEFDGESRYPRPNWWYGGGLAAFARAVRACPETNFIGHGPGFWAHISADGKYDKEAYPQGPVAPESDLVQLLRECPNLYCDISAGSGRNGITRDPESGRAFVTEFQDRVLYGRDCFDNQHQEALNGLGLAPEVLEKVYSANALRLVPL